MAISVGRLGPRDQWDQNMLDELFDNRLYPTGLQFKREEGYPNARGGVLLIPGRYWHMHTAQISEVIGIYDWVLAMRTGDEEDLFDIHAVKHPNIRWWVQTPRVGRDYGDAKLFGVGFPPHFNNLPPNPPNRYCDIFLSAQNTHVRRAEAFDALSRCEFSKAITATGGFTEGLEPKRYTESMCKTKTAPAPSGAFSPDTFRLYEALEAHAVPIADDVSPAYDSTGYWNMLFPDAPFPVYTDCDELPLLVSDIRHPYPRVNNRVAAWWMLQKRKFAHRLVDDLKALGAI